MRFTVLLLNFLHFSELAGSEDVKEKIISVVRDNGEWKVQLSDWKEN